MRFLRARRGGSTGSVHDRSTASVAAHSRGGAGTCGRCGALADALCAGGLPCAEVTLRTEAALDSLRALAGREELLLGAGTVHSAEQAAAAVDAGAQFVVTPGFNPRTVKWCQENQVPVFPGIATPTDLELALEHGVETVKFSRLKPWAA